MSKGNAIYEIRFFSGEDIVPTGETNGVASANVNSPGTGHEDVKNMFDGNLGHWSGGQEIYWQSYVSNAWVQYVFKEAPPPITRVVITWYGGTYVADLSAGPCYIESSSDGATWTTQYKVEEGDACCPQNTWDISLVEAATTSSPPASGCAECKKQLVTTQIYRADTSKYCGSAMNLGLAYKGTWNDNPDYSCRNSSSTEAQTQACKEKNDPTGEGLQACAGKTAATGNCGDFFSYEPWNGDCECARSGTSCEESGRVDHWMYNIYGLGVDPAAAR